MLVVGVAGNSVCWALILLIHSLSGLVESFAISRWLIGSVVYLGWIPPCGGRIILIATLRRREYLPLLMMLMLTMTSYLAWVVAQDAWALKTKYLLFLLPVCVAYAMAGLQWVLSRTRAGGGVVLLGLAVLVLAAHLYLYAFAVGGL